jgi:hypothetical protein
METSAPKYSIVIPVPKSATDQQMARYSDYRAFDKIDREKASVELLSFDIGSDLSDISKQFKSVKFKPFDLAVYGAMMRGEKIIRSIFTFTLPIRKD